MNKIVIYGKWKVWSWFKELTDKLSINNYMMDDADIDYSILDNCEKILISPWISPSHEIYVKYWNKIIWELDFVYDILVGRWLLDKFEFIGITWTDGKSTVSWILFQLFEKIFWVNSPYGKYIWLWWNFDEPVVSIVSKIIDNEKLLDKKHIVVVEVSSFMWYNLSKLKFDYSIWTNFQKDHLNWHTDMDDYFNSKLNLIKNTRYWSFLNNNIDIDWKNIYKYWDKFIESEFIWRHNQQNLNAVYDLIIKYIHDNDLDIDENYVLDVFKIIKPLSHRIELIKEIDGIKIYDDWKSTTAQSLKAAINSFEDKIIVISWWSDKWDDFDVLLEDFQKQVIWAVFMWQTSYKFEKISQNAKIDYKIAENMDQAVSYSIYLAKQKNSKYIVFSPGCASFDMFKDRLDRVVKFKEAIEKF
jgi:UDP-N-acetylmuramoylalanine--D-glutamate ligase